MAHCGRDLIDLTRRLFGRTPDAEALPLLLPAVVATDALDAALQGLPNTPLPLGDELAQGLHEALKEHPGHPGVWAALAIWQELTGAGDPSLTRKRARHHGGERRMDELRAELHAYGLV